MSRIICGMFDRSVDADAALDNLKHEGFQRSEVDAFYVSPPGQHAMTAIGGDVALLAGAATIPSARRQGAQLALLEERLRYAATHGCTVAMMVSLPGSGSQRNAERHGFRIAYTRVKWRQA